MTKIKYCIWDVGQTIYPYSLNPLNDYCLEQSSSPQALAQKGGIKSFDYKPLMRGDISFQQFCQELCVYSYISYNKQQEKIINTKLHDGVGEIYPQTIEAMDILKKQNVENCILSNALPNLTGTTSGLVHPDNAFTSFELKMLKPDPKIFQEVLRRLNAKPDEVIFVDDKKTNVNSAKELGIHGIVYKPETILHNIQNTLSPATKSKNSYSK